MSWLTLQHLSYHSHMVSMLKLEEGSRDHYKYLS